jgi:thymidylate kinase
VTRRALAIVREALGQERAVVAGSLPPGGRDLDLLARPAPRGQLRAALIAAGFVVREHEYAMFAARSGYVVELLDPLTFLPSAAAADELFQAALPLEGLEPLAAPAPAHALLILARRVERSGRLFPRHRARLAEIVSTEPGVWGTARAEAERWDATRAVPILERAWTTSKTEIRISSRLRGLGRRLTRSPVLVSISGVDGAGKSSHTHALEHAMQDIGLDVAVVWNDLAATGARRLAAGPAGALLRLARRQVGPVAHTPENPSPVFAGSNERGLREAWAIYVTVANALKQRVLWLRLRARHDIVVFDRGPLDLAVRMEVLYRAHAERQRRLIERLAPRAHVAFFLDLPPELALRRKIDRWPLEELATHADLYRELATRFGARRLDAGQDVDAIAAEIAGAVWRCVK